MDARKDIAIQLLIGKGAGEIPHSRRTLMSHLLGTHSLLESWGCDSETRLAGLCHSVYGTEYFQHSLFDLENRAELQQCIGVMAESLVYLFCTIDRRGLRGLREPPILIYDRASKNYIEIDSKTFDSLKYVELANFIDQLEADSNDLNYEEHIEFIEVILEGLPTSFRHQVHERLQK